MTVLHDLPFFLAGNLDYLGKACDLASAHLQDIGREEWTDELRLMINNHHWIDVTFTTVRFGIPRKLVVEVRATFPMNEPTRPWHCPASPSTRPRTCAGRCR